MFQQINGPLLAEPLVKAEPLLKAEPLKNQQEKNIKAQGSQWDRLIKFHGSSERKDESKTCLASSTLEISGTFKWVSCGHQEGVS